MFQVYDEARANAAVNNVRQYVHKKARCVPTWIPAPRSPCLLGDGSLSIIRTGIPFFRSDKARTRPGGPAPIYNDFHLDRVSQSLVVKLTIRTGCMLVLLQGCRGAVKV